MSMRRDNEVVVITGASGGVGRAVAREYAARGARVALLARGEAGLAAASEDVLRAGGQPLSIPTDVADFRAVESAADLVERELGPIDVWVNNAFTSVFAPFDKITAQEFKRVTEVSYLGYVHGTKAALSRMKPRDRGTIVQVGSALAYRGIPLQTAYCASKHAIQGFHESLRCELLHEKSNVHVTMVQLPAVNTPQFSWVTARMRRQPQPVPPIYQPEVVARAILHAGDHPKRREYWVGGSTVATLVANAVAPAALDRYLARTGFRSQLTDETTQAGRPANLWSPADGPNEHDYGAHGDFDAKATQRSLQVALSTHPGAVAGAAAVAAVGVATWRRIASHPSSRPRLRAS
jgi:NAD(P)-dependent dehydrogenase (short-subunit alcohol dehydrogenase family)